MEIAFVVSAIRSRETGLNEHLNEQLNEQLATLLSVWLLYYEAIYRFKKYLVLHNIVKQAAYYSPNEHKQQQDLTRFAIQTKGPDGKWTRKPLAYRESNNVHLLITRPPEICVNLVFKHIHAASSYTICRQFVPFIYCPL